MRIGVNCYLLRAEAGGVKQYFLRLFDWLLANDVSNEYIFFYFDHNLAELNTLKSGRWRQNAKLLNREDGISVHLSALDLYFCPFNSLWPRPVALPSVVTLVDIQEIYYPEFFQPSDRYYRAWHYPASTRAADRVITISQFSKDGIALHHRLNPAKIIVAHLSADPAYFESESVAERPGIPIPFEPYIIFPANRWIHKNHDALLRAMQLLKTRGETVSAVFTGFDIDGGYPLREKAKECGISDSVYISGYVTVPQMAYLYCNAEMLVFPSLFEGFGMPPIEAMAVGCPIAVARCTSLPEICGDAAEYFDPTDPNEIAEAILRIRRDSALRSSLVERGRRRAREFSAESMAKAHLRAFREAAASYSTARFIWQQRVYQPFHNWKVDKIRDIELPLSGGLFLPWAKKAIIEKVRRFRDLWDLPFERLRLRPLVMQIRAIEESGLFDHNFYNSQIHLGAGASRIGHYLLSGAASGLEPNPIFDGAWYRRANPESLNAGCNPLLHFIEVGASERRNPHPLFNSSWYLERYPDVSGNPLTHYLKFGAQEGRDPHPLFDTAYYLTNVRDYNRAVKGPLAHYLKQPPALAANTHALFDGDWYLENNPGVAASGLPPLLHYLTAGAAQGLKAHPHFDPAWYLRTNPDVAAAGIDPFIHYLTYGRFEGREPVPTFGAHC